MALKGIDVSAYQGIIDWGKVKADGVQFAIIKATQGKSETQSYNLFTDSKFRRNITEAGKQGIPCGVYHYFTATNEAETDAEARYFIQQIKPYKDKISLWAAVDVESKHIEHVSNSLLLKLVKRFAEAVRKAGFQPMLYTNPSFLTYRLDAAQFKGIDIWLAFWTNKRFDPVDAIKVWQYGTMQVKGIANKVDANEGYFTLPAQKPQIHAGQHFTIQPNSYYTNGVRVPERLVGRSYRVLRTKPDAVLLSVIFSWVKL